MSSLTRSEYRHEEQRRVTESPFKETKWDRHLDTLLTDLNDSVGTPSGSLQRSVVPATSSSGVITSQHGVPGSGDFHERREYLAPDQRTRVVQERYEHTTRADGGKPSTTYYYETQPGNQHHTSRTTSDYHEQWPGTLQYNPQLDTKSDTKYQTTTKAVTQYRENKPHNTIYYEASPTDHKSLPPCQTNNNSVSHYQTVKTSTEPAVKPASFTEYFEELPQAIQHNKSQCRTTKTVTEHHDQSPSTYRYYEAAPSTEHHTRKTVTEYRHQQTKPEHILPHHAAKSTTTYTEQAPVTDTYIDGQLVRVRYVDKKPITIYHEPRSDSVSGGDTPPILPAPDPAPAKPGAVYYERIIERQPIIHYYGARPQQIESGHQTLPVTNRSYTTVTTQHTHQPGSVPLSADTKPPTQQRVLRARSPDVCATNQAATKQVYTSSYSGDPIGAPSQDGVDTTTSTFDRPAGTSTPYRHTNVQKTTKTTKYTTSGSSEPVHLTPGDQLTTLGVTGPRHSPSPNPLDGLDRNLVPELSEPPQPGTTRVTKYEYRTSNQRDVSPQPAPAPALARTLPPPESARSYTDRREYTSTTNTLDRAPPPPPPPPPDVTDKTMINYVYSADQTVPPPPVVPGQPGNTTINYHIYNYGTLGPDGQPVGLPPGTLSPTDSAPPSEVDGPRGTLPRQVNNTTNSSTTTTYRYRDQTPPPPQVNTNTNTTTSTYRYRDQTPPPQVNTNTNTTTTTYRYRDQTPPPPPQANTNTNTSTSTTTYRYDQTSPPQQQQKSPPPGPDTTVSNSYVFEKHSRGPTPQRTVQPAQPGGPNTTYTTNTVTKHYTIGPDGTEVPVRAGSPPYDQQCPRFPVDEPPPPQPQQHTRTTTTTIERSHTHGSPFPARSPSPSGRRPHRDDGPHAPFPGTPRRPVDDIDTPRRVDELMAQIPDTPQDGTYPHGPRRRELNGRSTTTHFTVHESEPLLEGQTKVTLDARSGAVVPHTATKPMSGPPIYYPPGSTDFKPKPESEMMFQSYESRGGGKYKSGYKASGKSKSKGGSKESHSEGGAVIPICLPLCCGAACSVM